MGVRQEPKGRSTDLLGDLVVSGERAGRVAGRTRPTARATRSARVEGRNRSAHAVLRNEGNEVKRKGRREVTAADGTDEAGARAPVAGSGGTDPRDPVEGSGRRSTGPSEGTTGEASDSPTVSTKLARIAEMARKAPGMALTTLAHHIDVEWLHEAYRRTRKDGAVGVDGQDADAYGRQLESNLRSLLERAKSGSYQAPPVRRVYIPKGDGSQRPIGIPTFEDKVLQRAVAMVLEAVYEQDFLPCSFGFRPGRSALQALKSLRDAAMAMQGGWVVEVDIRKFFDTLDHRHLREILGHRIRDGTLLRLIGKWLHAGVQEEGAIRASDVGTPQGGVISPLLANIYLHEVLDLWFEREVRPRLRGGATLVRYADDFVIVLSEEQDARRVMEVLPKRFGRYGLTLHPDKTRLVPFKRPPRFPPNGGGGGEEPGTFDLLGFTHHWARSLKGNWVIKQRTADDRLARALRRVADWCRLNRHRPVREQSQELTAKVHGHYAYFGIEGNSSLIATFAHFVGKIWHKWLSRRSRKRTLSWAAMNQLLQRYPLPPPRLVHRYAIP